MRRIKSIRRYLFSKGKAEKNLTMAGNLNRGRSSIEKESVLGSTTGKEDLYPKKKNVLTYLGHERGGQEIDSTIVTTARTGSLI